MSAVTKVLVIAANNATEGAEGLHRWMGFIRGLPRQHIASYLYTPTKCPDDMEDPLSATGLSSTVETWRTPVPSLATLFALKTSKKTPERRQTRFVRPAFSQPLSHRLRRWSAKNILIPDEKVLWVTPSVNFLERKVIANNITVVISVGPPHSLHLIGYTLKRRLLKKRMPICWLADLYKPWHTYNTPTSTHRLSARHYLQASMEKKIRTKADGIITSSLGWKRAYERQGAKKGLCLYSGYDYNKALPTAVTTTNSFRILCLHRCYLSQSMACWEALTSLCATHEEIAKDLTIQLGNTTDPALINYLQKNKVLKEKISLLPYVAYAHWLERCRQAHVLLCFAVHPYSPTCPASLPSELFAYLVAGRPILLVGARHGEVANIAKEAQLYGLVEAHDNVAMKNYLYTWYQKYRVGKEPSEHHVPTQYSQEKQAERLASYLLQ